MGRPPEYTDYYLAVIYLRFCGNSHTVIADALGIPRHAVCNICERFMPEIMRNWRMSSAGNFHRVRVPYRPKLHDEGIHLKLPREQLRDVERYAKRNGIHRSEAIRSFIEWGLELDARADAA